MDKQCIERLRVPISFPRLGGSSISAWRGGILFMSVEVMPKASWRINWTSLHAIFLY